MPFRKSNRAVSKVVTEDIVKDFSKKFQSFPDEALAIQDDVFDEENVFWSGDSKRKSYVKGSKKLLRNRWILKFGVDLAKVPYAPFWYMGWGSNAKYGPRPVYQIAARRFARQVLKSKDRVDKSIDL